MLKETAELWNRLTPGTCIKLFDNYGYNIYVVLEAVGKASADLHVLHADKSYVPYQQRHRWRPVSRKFESTATVTAHITVCSVCTTEEKLVARDPEVWMRNPIGRRRTLYPFVHALRIAIASDSEIDPLEL